MMSLRRPVITFVTGNANKLKEVQTILGSNVSFELQNLNADLPEQQGDPEQVVRAKCTEAARQVRALE